jgi:anion-transporting  ArsA/GET3 family ATPase
MEIHFVTGKGGVGKSAVAAALAYRMSKTGKKVLLVELGDQSFYADYFELPKVEYKPVQTGFGFDVALWTGEECLREYALHLLKVERIYKLFFENAVTKALINVAPALSELAILGKITSGPPRNVGPKLKYDCIVVDAFASGHFLALLRAPKGMAEAISFGPMGEQSRSITAVLKNHLISKYYVVAFPEELPIVEGLELAKDIYSEIHIRPEIILNKVISVPPESLKEEPGSLLPLQHKLQEISKRQSKWIHDLKSKPYPVIQLPFVFSNSATDVVKNLEKGLLR